MDTVLIAIVASFLGATIWFSVKAKPLVDKPYRWATYIALTTGLASISLSISLLQNHTNNSPVVIVLLAITTVSVMLCCVGLLLRRRFGVVTFYIFYILSMLLPAFIDAYYNRPQAPNQARNLQSGLLLIYIIITAIYFKRRWKLLSKPMSNIQPTSASIGQ
jgi:uncharacterized membrane protein (DUF485 family)